MIGVDTNVLVRYFVEDDPLQTQLARRLIDGDADGPIFVSLVTMAELVWVLESSYRLHSDQIVNSLLFLLGSAGFHVQNEEQVFEATRHLKNGTGEFADVLIAGIGAWIGCSTTMTFDRQAARNIRFTLLQGS